MEVSNSKVGAYDRWHGRSSEDLRKNPKCLLTKALRRKYATIGSVMIKAVKSSVHGTRFEDGRWIM
jgi:hypothetical protein